ncbi:unnamed protein product [Rhizopus stolonifer]
MAYSKQTLILALFALILCFKSVIAITVEIHPHSKECFFEFLERDDSMSITYQVDEGVEDAIDFWLTNPLDNIMVTDAHKDQGAYTVTAPDSGKYRFCFSNEEMQMVPRLLASIPVFTINLLKFKPIL